MYRIALWHPILTFLRELRVYQCACGSITDSRKKLSCKAIQSYLRVFSSLLQKSSTMRRLKETSQPYYHGGSMATLEDAIKDMALNQLNKKLKPEQVTALVDFLKSLTGPLPEKFAAK